jgi:hypothetical protein
LKRLLHLLILTNILFSAPKALSLELDPTPFKKNYVVVNAVQNYPQGEMKKRFLPGGPKPLVGYRHRFDTSWLMGLGIQYKSLLRIDAENTAFKSPTIDILTFYHESLYAIRIFHPTHLLVGPRVLYLMPSQGTRIPLVKDNTEQVEIGVGLTVSFVQILAERTHLNIGGELWRGTKTSRLHGMEITAGFGWSL